MFVHHTGKGGNQRGTSKREDQLDVVIKLSNPSDYGAEEGARFEVKYEKARYIYGDSVEPIEAQLSDRGWLVKTVSQSNKFRVKALFEEGVSQKDMVEELGLSKGYVSKLVKQVKMDLPI